MIMFGDDWGEDIGPYDNWDMMNKTLMNGVYHIISTDLARGDIIIFEDIYSIYCGIVDKVTSISVEVSLLITFHDGIPRLKQFSIYDVTQLTLSNEPDAKEQFAAELLML